MSGSASVPIELSSDDEIEIPEPTGRQSQFEASLVSNTIADNARYTRNAAIDATGLIVPSDFAYSGHSSRGSRTNSHTILWQLPGTGENVDNALDITQAVGAEGNPILLDSDEEKYDRLKHSTTSFDKGKRKETNVSQYNPAISRRPSSDTWQARKTSLAPHTQPSFRQYSLPIASTSKKRPYSDVDAVSEDEGPPTRRRTVNPDTQRIVADILTNEKIENEENLSAITREVRIPHASYGIVDRCEVVIPLRPRKRSRDITESSKINKRHRMDLGDPVPKHIHSFRISVQQRRSVESRSPTPDDQDWSVYHAGFVETSATSSRTNRLMCDESLPRVPLYDGMGDITTKMRSIDIGIVEDKPRSQRSDPRLQDTIFGLKQKPARKHPLMKRPVMPRLINEISQGAPRARCHLTRAVEERPLKMISSFKESSGGVMHISQSRSGMIAVAACTVNGDPDYVNSVDLSYNTDGNICVWNPASFEVQKPCGYWRQQQGSTTWEGLGHWFNIIDVPVRTREDAPTGGQSAVAPSYRGETRYIPTPHYSTVLQVAFDPQTDDTFVSSGTNNVICKWETQDGSFVPVDQWTYPQQAHVLKYHSVEDLFAVGCFDGGIYMHSTYSAPDLAARPNPRMAVASMQWGRGPTGDMLFFTNNNPGAGVAGEAHALKCTQAGYSVLYRFAEVRGEGGLLAIDTIGSHLAIVNNSNDCIGQQLLHLYSVKTLTHTPIFTGLVLPPYGINGYKPPRGYGGRSIMDITFSPDGNALAIGRDDNCVFVYDIRSANEPLHVYSHGILSLKERHERFGHDFRIGTERGDDGPNQDIQKGCWGVTELAWMGRDCLVTGGSDGCIRRWNSLVSSDDTRQGEIVRQLDHPVANLTFGDVNLPRQNPLVAGDVEGGVYVFDYAR